MVKETKYDHQPVRIVRGLSLGGEYLPGQIVYLSLQTAAIRTIANTNDLSWRTLDIDDLLPAGVTRPVNAVAVILDAWVRDAASAANATYLAFASPGVIVAGKTQYVYPGNVNDRPNSRTVIVEITGDGKFAYMVEASGAAFDYTLKLVGWVIGGELYTHITLPSVDLKGVFHVKH